MSDKSASVLKTVIADKSANIIPMRPARVPVAPSVIEQAAEAMDYPPPAMLGEAVPSTGARFSFSVGADLQHVIEGIGIKSHDIDIAHLVDGLSFKVTIKF